MQKKNGKFSFIKSALLALNLIAIIGLAGAILATYIPPSLLPALSILALIYPILYIINLAFFISWLLLKSKWLFLSLLILLLGIPNFNKNFQFPISQSKSKESKDVKVLTYNVQLYGLIEDKTIVKQKRNNILQFIQTEEPQVICLQEYYSIGITPYAPLEEMKAELNLNTHYYESYFSPRYNQLTGLVIFSKYPAVDKGKLKFDGTRTFGIYTDLLMNGDTVRVYNIHLASIQLLPADIDFVVNAEQEEQKNIRQHALSIFTKLTDAFLLRELQMSYLVNQLEKCKYPIILCGDFNDTPSSFVYDQITSELVDSFREKGSGFSITYAGQIPFLRIDYIMKTDHFTTTSYRRYKMDFSDHYPLSASLSIK